MTVSTLQLNYLIRSWILFPVLLWEARQESVAVVKLNSFKESKVISSIALYLQIFIWASKQLSRILHSKRLMFDYDNFAVWLLKTSFLWNQVRHNRNTIQVLILRKCTLHILTYICTYIVKLKVYSLFVLNAVPFNYCNSVGEINRCMRMKERKPANEYCLPIQHFQ